MSIITFKDLQGTEQSVDLDGKFNVAFNCSCETIMQAMPDKCVTLLCADPPYGDGITDSSQTVHVERERERSFPDGTASDRGSTATSTRRLRFHGGGKKDPWKKYIQPDSDGGPLRGRDDLQAISAVPPLNFQNLPNQLSEPVEPGRRSTGKKS